MGSRQGRICERTSIRERERNDRTQPSGLPLHCHRHGRRRRRRFAGLAFIDQMRPDASTLALATNDVDVSAIQAGMSVTAKWRGKPIFIRNRTEEEIKRRQGSALSDLKDPVARNANLPVAAEATDLDRSAGEGKENWIVMIGSCTHLGCVPLGQQGDFGGWFLPVPRLALLRHGGPHPQGAGSGEPAYSELRVHFRHDHSNRLTAGDDTTMSGGHSTYTPKTGIGRWIDARLPLPALMYDSLRRLSVPRNLNYAYTFGGILSIMLVRADPDGRRAGDALLGQHDDGLRVGREDHARRELRLAAALPARQRRLVLLPSPSTSTSCAGSTTAPTRRRASCSGSSAASSNC